MKVNLPKYSLFAVTNFKAIYFRRHAIRDIIAENILRINFSGMHFTYLMLDAKNVKTVVSIEGIIFKNVNSQAVREGIGL